VHPCQSPSAPASARRTTRLLAVLAATCALLAATAAESDAALQPLHTGVSYVYVVDAEPAAFQHVREAGASLTLTPLEWPHVAPEQRPASWDPTNPSDPNYDWDEYDLWVQRAVAAGLTPVLQVRGAPRWAQRCPFVGPDTPCNPNPDDLVAFTTAAVRRYSGQLPGLPRVSYWQGLNEPNLSLFFEPQFVDGKPASADLYRVLINAFYDAVKAVDPSNVVIAAGLGPIAVPKFTIGPMQFARELLCMRGRNRYRPAPGDCGGGVRFDVFDVHPYTTGSPRHRSAANDVQLSGLPKLQRLLRAADRAGRIKGAFKHTPLWVTELSWDSNPPDPGGLPDRILTRWTSEALYRAWTAGVSDLFWFSLHDSRPVPNVPFSATLQSGLFYRGETVAQDQPKAVFYAFRFPFVAFARRDGLFVWGRTPTSEPGKVAIQVRRSGGRWRNLFTTRADENGMFQASARSRYGQNRKGAVRAQFDKGTSVPFSMKPIADFPHPPFGRPVG
jgi:hypothetical protein